jgi:hypothetical protein
MPGKSYEVYVQKGTPLWKVGGEKGDREWRAPLGGH